MTLLFRNDLSKSALEFDLKFAFPTRLGQLRILIEGVHVFSSSRITGRKQRCCYSIFIRAKPIDFQPVEPLYSRLNPLNFLKYFLLRQHAQFIRNINKDNVYGIWSLLRRAKSRRISGYICLVGFVPSISDRAQQRNNQKDRCR